MARHSPKGRRWHAMRMAALERDGFRCRCCGARGVRLEVDHIQPVSRAPERAWEASNLQALCTPCHLAKTDAEMGRTRASMQRRAWRGLLRDVPRTTEQQGT